MNRSALSRAVLLLVAAIACLWAPTRAATQFGCGVKVYNYSNHDAWVDVSWAYKITGWTIDKAFCLKPGQNTYHSIWYRSPELGPQIRVRAEIKNGDCRAGNITVVQDKADIATNWSPLTPEYSATINGTGSYSLRMQLNHH